MTPQAGRSCHQCVGQEPCMRERCGYYFERLCPCDCSTSEGFLVYIAHEVKILKLTGWIITWYHCCVVMMLLSPGQTTPHGHLERTRREGPERQGRGATRNPTLAVSLRRKLRGADTACRNTL